LNPERLVGAARGLKRKIQDANPGILERLRDAGDEGDIHSLHVEVDSISTDEVQEFCQAAGVWSAALQEALAEDPKATALKVPILMFAVAETASGTARERLYVTSLRALKEAIGEVVGKLRREQN
jgi:hypothetical protein